MAALDLMRIPAMPATTWVTPTRPIGSGELRAAVVPSPSSPQELSPHVQTRSTEPAIASVEMPLLAIWVTPVMPETGAGRLVLAPTVPLPSWPMLFGPQLNEVPSERTA